MSVRAGLQQPRSEADRALARTTRATGDARRRGCAATETRGPLAFVLQRPGLRYLGRISYCVYLIHRIVLALAHAILLKQAPVLRTWPDAWVTLAAVAVTVGLASLSWHCLESRLVELGHGFKYRHAKESPSA